MLICCAHGPSDLGAAGQATGNVHPFIERGGCRRQVPHALNSLGGFPQARRRIDQRNRPESAGFIREPFRKKPSLLPEFAVQFVTGGSNVTGVRVRLESAIADCLSEGHEFARPN